MLITKNLGLKLHITLHFNWRRQSRTLNPDYIVGWFDDVRPWRSPHLRATIKGSSLYFFVAVILILVSQRAEVLAIRLLGTEAMKQQLQEDLMRQRGNGPSLLEGIVFVYVVGMQVSSETE